MIRSGARWLAGGTILAAASYIACAAFVWLRWGHSGPLRNREDADPLLDRFMPAYEAAERQKIRVAAPAAVAFRAMCDLDLLQSPLIHSIFKARELILGSTGQQRVVPRALLPMVQAIGWSVLATAPGREVVVGTVTRPWKADVHFHAIPPGEFARFNEPGWVKIAFTLRADQTVDDESVARTETRVATTDPVARMKFRRYWALFLPGIRLIRRVSLRRVKEEAERCCWKSARSGPDPQGVGHESECPGTR